MCIFCFAEEVCFRNFFGVLSSENTMLQRSINQYKALIKNDKMFNSFTNYEVLDAVGGSASADVMAWEKWYEEVYCF